MFKFIPLILIFLFTLNANLQAEELKKSELNVVYFKAEWCPPCKKMEKSWKNDDVQEELEEYANFVKLDADNKEHRKYFLKYKVYSVPRVLILDKKGKVVKGAIGYMKEDELEKFLSAPIYQQEVGTIEEVGQFSVLEAIVYILYKTFRFFFGI